MRVSLEQAQQLKGELGFAAYACLDTTGTREIFDVLHPRLNEDQERTYRWSMAQLSPSVAMTLRGIKVDLFARQRAQKALKAEVLVAEKRIQEDPLVIAHWDGQILNRENCLKAKPKKGGLPGKHKWPRRKAGEDRPKEKDRYCELCGAHRVKAAPFLATSPHQVKHLLYDILNVPKRLDKQGKLTTNDDALQAIAKDGRVIGWTHDRKKMIRKRLDGLSTLCDSILQVRDLQKQLGFLEARLSERGRFHASFNVAGTWTGRWSSSKDPFQRGSNAQNIGEQHRHIFIPDPGRLMAYADLKTAESLKVAYLAGDEAYIEAHKGDVHTWVCRELWPDLPWTGDIKKDKAIASSNYPEWDNVPGHDFRFQSKRIQHGPLAGYCSLLTRQGWVKVEDIDQGVEIAVWKDGKVWWEVPLGYVIWEHDGDIVQLEGRNVSQHITKEHRIPLFNNGKLYDRVAGDFPLSYGTLPVSGLCQEGEATITEPEARLLACYWADGIRRKDNTSYIGLKKPRKQARLRTLLRDAGIEWEERVYKEGYIYFCWRKKSRKDLGWDILSWPLALRQAFLDELPHWDGHINPKTGVRRIFQVNKGQLEIIQTVAHISGFAAAIFKHCKSAPGEQQCWGLSLSKRQRTAFSGVTAERVHYTGKVYCPRTTAGYVLVRNNEKISVTGNTNFGLRPFGIALIAKIPLQAAKDAQERYFTAFPMIQEYQRWVTVQVRGQFPLYNALKREVRLFGRPWDGHTRKQGLAFAPQGGVGDILNTGLWRVWHKYDPWMIELLAQVHDAILCQFRPRDLDAAVAALRECMEIPIWVVDFQGTGRWCTIPVEIAVGENWSHYNDNPERGPINLKGLQ